MRDGSLEYTRIAAGSVGVLGVPQLLAVGCDGGQGERRGCRPLVREEGVVGRYLQPEVIGKQKLARFGCQSHPFFLLNDVDFLDSSSRAFVAS